MLAIVGWCVVHGYPDYTLIRSLSRSYGVCVHLSNRIKSHENQMIFIWWCWWVSALEQIIFRRALYSLLFASFCFITYYFASLSFSLHHQTQSIQCVLYGLINLLVYVHRFNLHLRIEYVEFAFISFGFAYFKCKHHTFNRISVFPHTSARASDVDSAVGWNYAYGDVCWAPERWAVSMWHIQANIMTIYSPVYLFTTFKQIPHEFGLYPKFSSPFSNPKEYLCGFKTFIH